MWQVKALPVSARKGMEVESITELLKASCKTWLLNLNRWKAWFLVLIRWKVLVLILFGQEAVLLIELFLFDESIVSTYSSSMKAYLFILFRQKVFILILIR